MIHWGFQMLESLLPEPLWARIQSTYCNPNLSADHESEGIAFYHGHSGELLFRSPPAVMRRVTRQKLRQLASEGLDIRWDKKLDGFRVQDDGVLLKFTDGSEELVGMVVGADGPRSRVREVLLGPEKAQLTQSGFICGFTSSVLGRERAEMAMKAHPIWAMAYHSLGVCAIGGTHFYDGWRGARKGLT